MDEQEKAFVIASIELKAEHDKKEKKKSRSKGKEKTLRKDGETGVIYSDRY